MNELLNEYMEQNRMHSMESHAGVTNLGAIVGVLGYDKPKRYISEAEMICNFLADNSGCMEAIVNWISEQNVPEWREKLEAAIESNEG